MKLKKVTGRQKTAYPSFTDYQTNSKRLAPALVTGVLTVGIAAAVSGTAAFAQTADTDSGVPSGQPPAMHTGGVIAATSAPTPVPSPREMPRLSGDIAAVSPAATPATDNSVRLGGKPMDTAPAVEAVAPAVPQTRGEMRAVEHPAANLPELKK